MAMQPLVSAFAGLALLCSAVGVARADETFICADGRMLQVTSANRGQLKGDPCVADWFGDDREQRAAQEAAKAAAEAAPKRAVTVKARPPRPVQVPGYNDALIMILTDPRFQ